MYTFVETLFIPPNKWLIRNEVIRRLLKEK